MNGSQHARILVADDDEDIRELVSYILENAGYEVTTVASGTQALETVPRLRPDLVLLDVSMPDRTGYDVCRQLQAAGPTAPPVIFLTAHSAASDRVAGLDLGAVDYVVKPFDAAELTARVRVALRQKAARDALAAQAATDGLTGLLNRRELDARAAELIALSRRYSRPLSCLMIDVDHFKQINDAYGHTVGDAVLREVARRIRAGCRVSDVAGRYGGEEFTLLLPDTDLQGAVAVAEKLRGVVSAAPVRAAIAGNMVAEAGDATVDVSVRVSVGVAARQPTMLDPESLYAAADNGLYRAKEAGRDHVSVAPTSGAPRGGGPA